MPSSPAKLPPPSLNPAQGVLVLKQSKRAEASSPPRTPLQRRLRGKLALSRRAFLASAGAVGGSLLLPRFLGEGTIRAENMGRPKRLIIFYTGHGTVPPDWRMPFVQAGTEGEASLIDIADPGAFSPILQPLHAYRSQLLVLDGLSLTTAFADASFNEHELGNAHALTASKAILSRRASAGKLSFDQAMIPYLGRPEQVALPYLALGINTDNLALYNRGGAGGKVPILRNPATAFSRLFPSAGDLNQPLPSEVLNRVHGEYEALAKDLPGPYQAQLAAHRDLVSDVQKRMNVFYQLKCGLPAATEVQEYAERSAREAAVLDLIQLAVACDRTRIISLQIGDYSNEEVGAPPGKVHEDYAHNAHLNDTARTVMRNYHRRNATYLARILDRLQGIPEEGGSALDNSIVLWCGELATGSHEFANWPVVIAGSAGGALRTGRYLSWAPSLPNPKGPDHPQGGMVGPAHNRLFVSLGRALGASDMQQFGDAEATTSSGGTLPLTGALDRLS